MFYGLAGDVVATIGPETEADPVALLMNYLTYFGNVIGRTAHYLVGETAHFTNIYPVLVGETSARKGASSGRITPIFRAFDPEWARRKSGGLSSGEGLIHAVRDPHRVLNKKTGIVEEVDPGVADKRLMIEETEFSQALAVMKREGNVVSRVMRDAWDCLDMIDTKTKHSPTRSTFPFISIAGHITPGELRNRLDSDSYFNGFANRFLFVCVKRSREIPDEGPLAPDELKRLVCLLQNIIEEKAPLNLRGK